MLEDFQGQDRVKEQIRIILTLSKIKGKIPHIGLFGPMGMGKTTLASLLAKEAKANIIYINSTGIKDPHNFLTKIYEAKKEPDKPFIVFIDEAHALHKNIVDNLLSVLEEPGILYCISPREQKHWKVINGKMIPVTVKKGEPIEVTIPTNITFILATTHKGHLSLAILSRLKSIDLDEYTDDDYLLILKRKCNINISDDMLLKIVKVSRNPRDAKGKLDELIAFIRTFSIQPDHLSDEHFTDFCKIIGIEKDGCTISDLNYLKVLYSNSQLGINSIASNLDLSLEEVQNVIEPWLLKLKYVAITPRGRILTLEGKKRIGYSSQELDDPNFILQ